MKSLIVLVLFGMLLSLVTTAEAGPCGARGARRPVRNLLRGAAAVVAPRARGNVGFSCN